MNLINTDPFRELENHPTKRTETKLQNLLRSFKNNKYLSEKFINKYIRNHEELVYFMEQQNFTN